MLTKAQLAERGRRAKAILDDELVQGALKAIGEDCCQIFFATTSDEVEKRETAHMMMAVSKLFEFKLRQHMLNGTIAENDMQHEAIKEKARNGRK